MSLVVAHVFRNEHSFHIEIALNYNSFLFHFFQTDSNKNVEDRHQCQQWVLESVRESKEKKNDWRNCCVLAILF